MRFSHLALATVALLWTAPHAQAAHSCKQGKAKGTFTEIAVPGADETNVTGIADDGAVVGVYRAGDVTTSFVLNGGMYTDVHIAGSTTTRVFDINSSGVMAGSYDDAVGTGHHGFIWQDGTVTTIDVPGAIATSVHGINDAGTVVGLYLVPGGEDGVEHGLYTRTASSRRSITRLAQRHAARHQQRWSCARRLCHPDTACVPSSTRQRVRSPRCRSVRRRQIWSKSRTRAT